MAIRQLRTKVRNLIAWLCLFAAITLGFWDLHWTIYACLGLLLGAYVVGIRGEGQ